MLTGGLSSSGENMTRVNIYMYKGKGKEFPLQGRCE